MKSRPVNWLPWSVLKISGRPWRSLQEAPRGEAVWSCRRRCASASSSAATQNDASIVFDSRHERTARLDQSITATR